jgi:hypothetical protein
MIMEIFNLVGVSLQCVKKYMEMIKYRYYLK